MGQRRQTALYQYVRRNHRFEYLIACYNIAVLLAVFPAVFQLRQVQIQKLALINYLISGTVIYGSVSFLIFMLYSVLLMIIPRKSDFDYIIIHGAGLLGGDRVSKLLQDRIDKAIDVYLKNPTPTIMIPSGGQGSDETISEAEAMSHVAFYYWPSALIREFVAIHNEKKHFLLFIAGWILWIIMPMLYALHTI
jgi:hypothetical protein